MATISRRTWSYKGAIREAWVARYNDGTKWRLKTFARQKEAAAWLQKTQQEIGDGTHTPERMSKTIGDAGDAWLAEAESDGLEQSTTKGYREHLTLHVKPFLSNVKLARLTGPMVAQYRKDLRASGRSPVMVDKVVRTLGGIIAYALEHGMVGKNVVRSTRSKRRRGQEKRQRKRVAIPTKAEIRDMIANAQGRWRPFIITAIFTGLRASELRGLTWDDVNLDEKVLWVNQRADAWNKIGVPKSMAGNRLVPLAPMVVNALKEWRLRCPRRKRDKDDEQGKLVLVFPNGQGNAESHANILNRGYWPLQIACEITRPVLDAKGKPKVDDEGNPIVRARYGLHALRHAAASLFIEQGMNPKRVQTLMGHANIQITFDTYGHLWPTPEDDQRQMAQLQARLMTSV